MARVPAPEEKPLFWIGTSLEDLRRFPEAVKDDVGGALAAAQFGGKHILAKPWKGEGGGVFEVVEAFDGNAYRAVYTVRFVHAVYVLHVFQKKSPSGIRTAKPDVELVHRRLAAAKEHYETFYDKGY